jgi:hypothetical protein
MTGRVKYESLSEVLDGLLQIFHLSQLHKASTNGDCEAMGRCRATWMTGWTKIEPVMEVRDGLLQVIHSSELLESFVKSHRQVVQHIRALDIPQRTLLKLVSMFCNCAVQSFPSVWRLRLLNTS